MKLKSKWLGGLLVLVAFLFAVPTAYAAVKPPTPPKPPKIVAPTPPKIVAPTPPRIVAPTPPRLTSSTPAPVERVALILTSTTLTLRAIDLTPGDGYDFTFQVWECDDATPYYLGGSLSTTVRDDGSYAVTQTLADLTAPADGPVCRIVAWLRPVGSAAADVSTYPDGTPIRAEQHF